MRKNLLQLIGATAVTFAVAMSAAVLAQRPGDTLNNRAKQAGGKLVWRYRPNHSVIYANVEELAKRSDLIVVGRTRQHLPALTPDKKFVTDDFVVHVQEVIKGDVAAGKDMVISLPGGAYKFPDGTFAYVMAAHYKPAEKGGIYIFFLKTKKKLSGIKGYQLSSATQGLFGFKNGQVEPADQFATDPIVVRYRGMSAAAFLAEVHKAVPRQKK